MSFHQLLVLHRSHTTQQSLDQAVFQTAAHETQPVLCLLQESAGAATSFRTESCRPHLTLSLSMSSDTLAAHVAPCCSSSPASLSRRAALPAGLLAAAAAAAAVLALLLLASAATGKYSSWLQHHSNKQTARSQMNDDHAVNNCFHAHDDFAKVIKACSSPISCSGDEGVEPP